MGRRLVWLLGRRHLQFGLLVLLLTLLNLPLAPPLQAQAYERRLFTADQEAPPSQLHPGRTLLQVPGTVGCYSILAAALGSSSLLCFTPPPKLTSPTWPSLHSQDLLCAATHSRAAYGFALAAGFMADVASYVRLQTVQQLT